MGLLGADTAAAAATTDTDTATPPAGDAAAAAPSINYPAGLDKEYHGNETILKHYNKEKNEFDMGSVMKGLVHASSSLGRDKMLVPHKDFTPEQWKETFSKLGVPKSSEEYMIDDKYKGLFNSPEDIKSFKEEAHKSGMLPSQIRSVLEFNSKASIAKASKMELDAKVEFGKSLDSLKSEWGQDYDRNLAIADQSLKEFASEEDIAALDKAGLLNSTIVTKIFAKIGKAISDDKFVDNISKDHGKSTEEVDSEIKSYYTKDHPFMSSTHPQNKYYTDRMLKLLEMKHGKK